MKPLLDPKTLEPVDPKMLEAIFPRELLAQEMSMERFIQIPEEIRDVYRLWRPTPMYRALGLERALKTPARIYYKYEGVSPLGSHKPLRGLFHRKRSGRRVTKVTIPRGVYSGYPIPTEG